MPPKTSVSISVSLLIFSEEANTIILSKTDHLPQGKLFFGESLEEAAQQVWFKTFSAFSVPLQTMNQLWQSSFSAQLFAGSEFCQTRASPKQPPYKHFFDFTLFFPLSPNNLNILTQYGVRPFPVRDCSKLQQDHYALEHLWKCYSQHQKFTLIPVPPFQPKPLPQTSILSSEQRKEKSEETKKRFRRVDLVSFVLVPQNAQSNGTELLMVEERSHRWFLPAGHVDPGESMKEGAEREAIEESGLVVECLGLSQLVFALGSGYSALHFVFVARPKTPEELGKDQRSELKTVADKESRSAKFFGCEKLVKELHDRTLDQQYRKPFEIGPFIKHAVSENFAHIPIFRKSR